MYTQTNLATVGSLIPGVDVSLHTFLSVSWDVLLPYTLFGIGLMAYSQIRLMRGQHFLESQPSIKK